MTDQLTFDGMGSTMQAKMRETIARHLCTIETAFVQIAACITGMPPFLDVIGDEELRALAALSAWTGDRCHVQQDIDDELARRSAQEPPEPPDPDGDGQEDDDMTTGRTAP